MSPTPTPPPTPTVDASPNTVAAPAPSPSEDAAPTSRLHSRAQAYDPESLRIKGMGLTIAGGIATAGSLTLFSLALVSFTRDTCPESEVCISNGLTSTALMGGGFALGASGVVMSVVGANALAKGRAIEEILADRPPADVRAIKYTGAVLCGLGGSAALGTLITMMAGYRTGPLPKVWVGGFMGAFGAAAAGGGLLNYALQYQRAHRAWTLTTTPIVSRRFTGLTLSGRF